jgi:hypothetical protein
MLDFLHGVQTTRTHHPLAKFAGVLSDVEANELRRAIKADCRQLDLNEW